MEDIIVNSNKEFALKAVKDQLELFVNAIYKKNKEIKELRKLLLKSNKERTKLARAYAKKIKVLK